MIKPAQTAFALFAVLCAGCASAERTPEQKPGNSALRNAMRSCGIVMVAGAAGGALLANPNNRTEGALVGAAVAGGGCLVLKTINTRREIARLAALESEAAASGVFTRKAYYEADGIRREFAAQPGQSRSQTLPGVQISDDGSAFVGPCRSVATTVTLSEGQSGTVSYSQVYCQTALGNMRPLPE